MLALVAALLWGMFAAQFLIQAIVSISNGLIAASGLLGSKVDRTLNLIGAGVGIAQGLFFALLFAGGYWLSLHFLDYRGGATVIAMAVTFALSLIFSLIQLPGKVYLAWLCAWEPNFLEMTRMVPANQQFACALNWRREKRSMTQ